MARKQKKKELERFKLYNSKEEKQKSYERTAGRQEQDKTRLWFTALTIIVLLLMIAQTLSFYVVYKNEKESLTLIKSLENKTNEKITILTKDVQSNINSLTKLISSLFSTQETIQKQVAEIKATTSADFSGIIEQEIRGVVTIKTDISQGTGFFVTENGYVVTNAHVLSGASFANIYTYNNNKYSSKLIGYDSDIDLALLKISADSPKLNLGDSDDVRIGEKVIAIGNPLGLSFTATEGIISARDRKGSNDLPYYFQTDVSLNPGNSGGPLINTKGEVIGINNFKISGAENIGFALESNYIKRTINEISLENLNMTLF